MSVPALHNFPSPALTLNPPEHLNEDFITFLLNSIESPPSTGSDSGDQIPDTFLKLILAFNLHFEMPEDNVVMKVLAQRGTAKTFTEMLMLLVNRDGEGLNFSLCLHPLQLARGIMFFGLSVHLCACECLRDWVCPKSC